VHTPSISVHPALILCPICVPQNGGVNIGGVNKKYSHKGTTINANKPTKLC